jgi:hypothetical protein
MSEIHFLFRLFCFLLLSFGVHSCGLKFTPSPSLEELSNTRKTKLEEQLKSDFAAMDKKYVSLTYGESVTVKPISYQRLDSLFEVKYQMSQRGMSTKALDPQIESQKMILLSDTTEVLFLETHWFELVQDTTYEFIIAKCYLNNRNILRKMEYEDYFTTGKWNHSWAERYMEEDWFTQNLGYTSNEDLNFYAKMKNKEFNLQGEEKAAFLENVFLVMRFANEAGNLSYQTILIKLAAYQLKNELPNFKVSDYIFSFKKAVDPLTKETEYVVEATSVHDKNILITRKFDGFFMPLN